MAGRLSALRTRRTLLPRNIFIFIFLVLIPVNRDLYYEGTCVVHERVIFLRKVGNSLRYCTASHPRRSTTAQLFWLLQVFLSCDECLQQTHASTWSVSICSPTRVRFDWAGENLVRAVTVAWLLQPLETRKRLQTCLSCVEDS
jgi:hypothetical protein